MRGQYQIYKGTGALQASLIPYNQDEHKTGAIYIEAANCKDKKDRSYDWANKIKFALGMSDIVAIFDMLDSGGPQPISLFHAPGGSIGKTADKGKRLNIRPGEGKWEGTWTWQFEDQIADSKVMVSMTRGEFRVFVELMKSALPAIYGWDSYGSYDSHYRANKDA